MGVPQPISTLSSETVPVKIRDGPSCVPPPGAEAVGGVKAIAESSKSTVSAKRCRRKMDVAPLPQVLGRAARVGHHADTELQLVTKNLLLSVLDIESEMPHCQ